jgi:hypothetical protein
MCTNWSSNLLLRLTIIATPGVRSAAPNHRLSSTSAATAYNWLPGSTATHMHTNARRRRLPTSACHQHGCCLQALHPPLPRSGQRCWGGGRVTPVSLPLGLHPAHTCAVACTPHTPHTPAHQWSHLTAPPPPWACPAPSPSGGSAHPGHAPSHG